MPIIKANVSSDDLLHAVEQMDEVELKSFLAHVLAFQAKRKAPSLSQVEAQLLQQINAPLPAAVQQRYNDLIDLRRAENLSPEEYAELLRLTEEAEAFETQRITYMAQLAQLRGRTLPELMADLGIKTPDYA
jgi:hypothetical protein